MKYCKRCVYPDTKPGLLIGADGLCSGCRNQEAKRNVDWASRFKSFRTRLHERRPGSGYDCVIPVSGGKDSHAQVHYIKKVMGLNPLCVTVRPQVPTEIGRRNLENLKRYFAVDVVTLEPREDVERRITVGGFLKNAWPNWGHDKLIYSWPIRFAVGQRIPFVIMGENHDFETGGKDLGDGAQAFRQMIHSLDGEIDIAAWNDQGLTRADLEPYIAPSAAEFERSGTEILWLGYAVDWDSFRIYQLAHECGFRAAERTMDGHIDNYHGVDDAIVMVNAWLKFVKFGFGRVSDVAFNHISYGRMTREHAIALVNAREGILDPACKRAWLDYAGLDENTFDATVARFANREIVALRDERWVLKSPAA